jgi:hypothetical protein
MNESATRLGVTWFTAPDFACVSDLESGVVSYAQLIDGRIVGRAYHLAHLPWFKAEGPNNVCADRAAPTRNTADAAKSMAAVLLFWARGWI